MKTGSRLTAINRQALKEQRKAQWRGLNWLWFKSNNLIGKWGIIFNNLHNAEALLTVCPAKVNRLKGTPCWFKWMS